MRAVFTEAALADLKQLLTYTSQNYPARLPAVQQRLRDVIARIETWPASARAVAQRPGVRVAPLLRFPYRVIIQGRARANRNPAHPPHRARAMDGLAVRGTI